MPRRIPTSYTPARRRVVAAIGDSLTWNNAYGVLPHNHWPERLAARLRALTPACAVKARNFAISGNNSWNLLDRFACVFQFGRDGALPAGGTLGNPVGPALELPDVALIWVGVNDPSGTVGLASITRVTTTATATSVYPHHLTTGVSYAISGANQAAYNGTFAVTVTGPNTFTYTMASDPGATATTATSLAAAAPISSAQTTLNLRAMARWLRNAAVCRGYVAAETALPAGGQSGDRYVVLADGSSTGGNNPAVAGAIATGTPTVWEYRNGLAGVAGWGRAADRADVTRVAYAVPHFLNYTSGGDTVDPGGTHSGQLAGYAAVDAAVRAAATAEGAPVADPYAFMQARINGGFDTAASASWHVLPTNQHLNVYGEDLVAQCFLAAVQAQSGWVAALTP